MNFFLHLLKCEQKQSLPHQTAGSQLVDKVDKLRLDVCQAIFFNIDIDNRSLL
jgi:hypothetical protein